MPRGSKPRVLPLHHDTTFLCGRTRTDSTRFKVWYASIPEKDQGIFTTRICRQDSSFTGTRIMLPFAAYWFHHCGLDSIKFHAGISHFHIACFCKFKVEL